MSEPTMVNNAPAARNYLLADQILSNSHPKHKAVDEDDASMVAGLRKRRASVFAEMVQRYRHVLLAVALRITKNHEDSEDVVQEAFFKVFQRIESFRGESLFRTWVTRIVINEALMKVRSNAKHHISIDEHSEDEAGSVMHALPGAGYTPEESCSLRELESLAARCFRRVSPASRPVLKLCVQMELSPGAAAKRLGLNLSTVKSRLWRGRMELRKALEQHYSSQRDSLVQVDSDARRQPLSYRTRNFPRVSKMRKLQ